MKRLFFALSILALFLSACKEEPFLSVEPGSLSFDQAGGRKVISVSANYPWKAEATGTGFSVSPSSGDGSTSVTVTAAPANSDEPTQGSITFMSEGLRASISLSRSPKSILTVGNGFTAPVEGGSFTVDVQYNVDMKVSVDPSATWLKFVKTKALTSGKLEFAVDPNDTYDERDAKVTVSDAAGIAAPVEIVVKQESLKALIVGEPKDMPVEGGTLDIDIQFNTKYDVIVEDSAKSWIKYVKTKSLTRGTLQFEISANDQYAVRTGIVTIRPADDKVEPVTITVVQAARVKPQYVSVFLPVLLDQVGDCSTIKKINFNVNSDVTTENKYDNDAVVYYSISNSELNFYTPALKYKLISDAGFGRFKEVEELDLTNVDLSEAGPTFMMPKLKKINFNSENKIKPWRISRMFEGCTSLESVDVSMFDVSDISSFSGIFRYDSSLKSVDLSGWDTHNATDLSYLFAGCTSLEEVDISSFNTSNVTTFSSMFWDCRSLKSLDLRHFDISKAQNLGVMFYNCQSMTSLDLTTFVLPSNCDIFNVILDLGKQSEKCVIKCTPETCLKLMDGTQIRSENLIWELTEPMEIYESKSYEKDGQVKQVQKATKGKGINVVFMGDAFSDRMIDNGVYDQYMNEAIEGLFSKEPFTSCREFFNIYTVTVVSKNEYVFYETALNARPPHFNGNQSKIDHYASLALGHKYSRDDEFICMIVRCDAGGGRGSLGHIDRENDYGAGGGIARFGTGDGPDEVGAYTLHELGGHAFGKLGDEYWATEGTIPQEGIDDITEKYQKYGMYKNIDFTGDVTKVKWNKFIFDPRYASEGLGSFEGGLTYPHGVWRPADKSIMCYGTTFNAPSREAIYIKINKMAYGEEWQYDYETFVKFDLKL